MPYVRKINLGALGEAEYGSGFGSEGVSFEQCQAIINHQAAGGLETQFACASRGWWGNRPSIQQRQTATLPPIPQLQMAVQPTVAQPPPQPLPPQVIIPPPPQLFEETVNTIPECEGLDSWIAENKVLALGIAVLIYAVR